MWFVETPEINDRLYVEHLNAKILRSRKVLQDKRKKRRKNHDRRHLLRLDYEVKRKEVKNVRM